MTYPPPPPIRTPLSAVDKNQHRLEEADERFKEIQNAYEVLSDKHERAWYCPRLPAAPLPHLLLSYSCMHAMQTHLCPLLAVCTLHSVVYTSCMADCFGRRPQ